MEARLRIERAFDPQAHASLFKQPGCPNADRC